MTFLCVNILCFGVKKIIKNSFYALDLLMGLTTENWLLKQLFIASYSYIL